MIDLPTTFYT